MQIAVFSTKPYDRQFLDAANADTDTSSSSSSRD